MRRVLILAPRFPDLIVPGGSTRVEKFVRYLPSAGWQPLVLGVRLPRGADLDPVHEGPWVTRTPSHYGSFVRAYRARHLDRAPPWKRWSIELARRAKNLVLVPDDVVLWWAHALPAALGLIRRHRPQAIFASGPPYSVLLLGGLLRLLTKVPLVADLRDDWAGNPLAGRRNLVQGCAERPLERLAVRLASRVLHVTQASLDLYRSRYPGAASKMLLVPNGYDDEDFRAARRRLKKRDNLRLLHLGSLKGGRSPKPVFSAMSRLAATSGEPRGIRFRLVGTHHREHVQAGEQAGLNGAITWEDRLPRRQATKAMVAADALVLLPSQDAPTAIPGKVYEYLRSGRPILTVSEPNETTRFLARFPHVVVRAPGDVDGIAATLETWRSAARLPSVRSKAVKEYSRKRLASALAAVLDEVAR